MKLRQHALVLTLAGVLVAGCGGDGDDSPPTPTGPPADAVVSLESTATDLDAMDLRSRLLELEGVEGVVYDQAQKQLRVDFADAATAQQKDQVLETARADDLVTDAGDPGDAGRPDAPDQQPAPGSSAS